jgi:roadblock/LC7 domain-containing protein
MADLDKLMGVKGVWAAGEFSPDGKLIAYKGNISEEHAAMAAMMCAANTMMAEMQTQGYTAFSGQEWTPLIGLGSDRSQVFGLRGGQCGRLC